ncbi:PH domain-containing protein [Bacillus sp. FJAT-53711]|uniref:PH domain-containing protein n=1 Tax=Bacillus yunxiaonensis TaxID=3127665 RepID=A0ABU8FYX4_9BACI
MSQRLLKSVDERAIQVWRLTAFSINIIVWIAYGGAIYWLDAFRSMTNLQLLFLCFFGGHAIFTIGIYPKLRWKRWRYMIRGQEIDLQRGVFITEKTLIPMIRVQHVDVRQGPFLRYYQLASVDITTAATTHTIPAIAYEDAEYLRGQLSTLAQVAVADV